MSEKRNALEELEKWLGLHQEVRDIIYVVDGYEVTISPDDGNTIIHARGETIAEAILAALDKTKELK